MASYLHFLLVSYDSACFPSFWNNSPGLHVWNGSDFRRHAALRPQNIPPPSSRHHQRDGAGRCCVSLVGLISNHLWLSWRRSSCTHADTAFPVPRSGSSSRCSSSADWQAALGSAACVYVTVTKISPAPRQLRSLSLTGDFANSFTTTCFCLQSRDRRQFSASVHWTNKPRWEFFFYQLSMQNHLTNSKQFVANGSIQI